MRPTALGVRCHEDVRGLQREVVVLVGVVAVDPLEEVTPWLHPHGPRQVPGEVLLDGVILLLLQGLDGVRKITRHSSQLDGCGLLQDGSEFVI